MLIYILAAFPTQILLVHAWTVCFVLFTLQLLQWLTKLVGGRRDRTVLLTSNSYYLNYMPTCVQTADFSSN